MAKQRGVLPVSGTLDNITFYELDGQYYARKKSTLSRKRVLTEPGFERTRRSAEELKRASVLASKVYRTLDKGKRKVSLYRKMTGMAKKRFAEGWSEKEIEPGLSALAGFKGDQLLCEDTSLGIERKGEDNEREFVVGKQ